MLTYKIYPRESQTDKKGLCSMYCRVICDRVITKFALDLKIDLKHFDVPSNTAKSTMTNYRYVNSILKN